MTPDGADALPPRAVTLQSIADALRVSRSTVSNAYNHPERLTVQLRALILAKAGELGYAGPDPAARRLRLGRNGVVGLFYTEPLSYAFSDPAVMIFLREVTRECETANVGLLLLPSPSSVDASAAIRNAVVDAVCIWSVPEQHPALAAALTRGLPTVFVDEPRLAGTAFVGVDDHLGGRLLGEHLLALGHRRIGVLTPRLLFDDYSGWVDDDRVARSTYAVFRSRLAGLRAALAAAGVPWESVGVQERRTNTPEEGAIGTAELLSRTDRPTAVIALSDQLAFGALDAAAAAGLQVPGDLTVTGFDDVPESALPDRSLTTVRQPLVEKGRRVGRLLLELSVGGPVRQEVLGVELVVRGSSGPPARSALLGGPRSSLE